MRENSYKGGPGQSSLPEDTQKGVRGKLGGLTSFSNVPRLQLSALLEGRRERLRALIDEMAAEDEARRKLCAPPAIVGVVCNDKGEPCRYYSADPGSPLACGDVLYLNAFLVSPIKAIFADLGSFRHDAEFFVDLRLLGTFGTISETSFRSPESIFGDKLLPAKLLPPPFLKPQVCTEADTFEQRLREGFDFADIFASAEDRSDTTRANINLLNPLRPTIEFWLKRLATAVSGSSCTSLPGITKDRLQNLVLAVTAIEAFGNALTSGDAKTADDASSLDAVKKLTRDF